MRIITALIALLTASCLYCIPSYSPIPGLLEDKSDAVVRLEHTDRDGICTAFHIGNNRFLTAAHCIDDLKPVLLSNSRNPKMLAAVLNKDPALDVALLITYHFNGPALSLAEDELVGSEVIAMGYPGYMNGQFTWSNGYLNNVVNFRGKLVWFSRFLIAPGFSGGPVINIDGQVIGMSQGIIPYSTFFDPINHSHIDLSILLHVKELRKFMDSSMVR